jgi:MOSC domain-containing protein YiiM
MLTLAELTARHARPGHVSWIGIRPARRAPVEAVEAATIRLEGLEGDRRTQPGKRAVTLIQAEHLPVIAALAGLDNVDPSALRRNVVVGGLNLAGLKGRLFRLGMAILRGTGPCAPCARMEEALGHGGYAAMRGHGGLCAEVVEPGFVRLDDAVMPLDGE